MELKMTWKDRCDMQMEALVKVSMNTYGCTEEQAYETVFKALCSIQMYKLVNEILRKDEE